MMLPTSDAQSRYRVLSKWASGGMADVYVARQHGGAGFDKIVALKVLRDPGDTTVFRDMFLEEVRTAALLNHPGIVQTFDAGELDNDLFMAMELVQGETLGRVASAVLRQRGSFPVELAVAIARDVANALEYAHTLSNLDGTWLQIVHRDVSPSNILLSFEGMVKLLDFGIARVATKLQPTQRGVIKGKFSYMSPEQARAEPLDHRSDIYSLGIVLWQLLTGRVAFPGDSDLEVLQAASAPQLPAPSMFGAQCSRSLDAIVMRALSPVQEQRHASAAELASDLSHYLARNAPSFDATKRIRAVMTACFDDRRQRLARIVKSSEVEIALDELDLIPHRGARRSQGSVAMSSIAQGAPLPVAPLSSAMQPSRRSSWTVPLVIAATALGFAAGIANEVYDVIPGDEVLLEAPAAPSLFELVERRLPPPLTLPTLTAERVAPEPSPPPRVAPIVTAPKAAPLVTSCSSATRSPSRATSGRSKRRVRIATAASAPQEIAPPASVTESLMPPVRSTPPPDGSGSAIPPIPRPAPAATAPDGIAGSAHEPGTLDAVPTIARVRVDGSLPTSEIQSALERTQSPLRECYRAAARHAIRTPAVALQITFVIDEARAVRGIRVSHDTLGLGRCVQGALATIRTRSAPDVGTVDVTAHIRFEPTTR